MALSPSPGSGQDGLEPSDASLLARDIAAFGHELAGTLRRASVVDLLIRHLRELLAPSEITVALYGGDPGQPDALHTWPEQVPARLPVLQLGLRRGPSLVAGNLAQRLREAGLAPPPDIEGSWCVVPLVAKSRITGAVAIRAVARRFAERDLALVEGLAAAASIAIESARLVDLTDEGRRSWQAVVDAISLALCIVDDQGSIRRANRAFADLVTAQPAALVGRPWHAFTPPDWTEAIRRAVDAPAGSERVDLRLGERSLQLTTVPLSDGEELGVVLLFDDLTERRRLQDQLIQSEKMSAVGQLIAGIAHDLNNPLASVVGFADFLGELPDVPSALREPLAVIREEAERASKIVKNLLSFARKQERQRRRVPLDQLLESTFVLLRNQLLAYRVDAQVEVEPDLPPIDVDPNQLQQVFVNLINNAAQAIASTGRPGTITVRGRRFLDGIAVDVSDDGPGMSEVLAGQVFEPFFTTKGEGQGTGLGLSISQGIVKEHGGRITLHTREGEGATFTVHLPLGGDGAPVEPPDAPVHPVRTLRVLVVDDEPHILHYMRATLEAWGHEVETADDGDAALARAAAGRFDLIISDLRMPRLGGREFYERLAEEDAEAAHRLVFSTGDTVRGDTLRFLERLGRPFLHKPFSLAELRTLLAAVSRDAAGGE